LDSSVIIDHFRNRLDIFQLISEDETLFMPLVVLGELLKGAFKSGNIVKHRSKIDALQKVVAVINPDSATAEHYAKIAVTLEAKGRAIPENDLWIAAVALEADMPLATRDQHFDHVDGLSILRW
jgi:tRNA(fMet)-specific endonuclease VapC